MVILALIVKRARVKALVKDKRAAIEAYGTYVEVTTDHHKLYDIIYVHHVSLWTMYITGSIGDNNVYLLLLSKESRWLGIEAILCSLRRL